MRTIERTIDIDAPTDTVWKVLSDFDHYPEWNPFMTIEQTEPRVGEKLRIKVRPPGRRGVKLKPTVKAYEPGRTLQWLGHLGIPGIFDGAHELTVEPIDDRRSRFVQREEFRGILIPLTGGMLDDTAEGFAAMNEALKERAEGGSRPGQ